MASRFLVLIFLRYADILYKQHKDRVEFADGLDRPLNHRR